MIVRCVSYASFIDTIALFLSHERFFILLLESFTLLKLSPREVIGSYTEDDEYIYCENIFPAPLEVDGYLYMMRNKQAE